MKVCSSCKLLKDSFHKNKSKADGLSDVCKQCALLRAKQWAKNNPDRYKDNQKRNYLKTKEERSKKTKIYVMANREKVAKTKRAYFEKNRLRWKQYFRNWCDKHPEERKQKARLYYEKNKSKWPFLVALRRASIAKRTPAWLTGEQKQEIKKFYLNCPKGYEVDHIIPLRGKLVSGLHVPWNLQYLTPDENLKKNNKFEPMILKSGVT